MAGKRYSAGAIFLQVVPVFGNVQNAIRDEASNIDRALGDQMERSGQKAGQRAGKAMTEEISKEGEKAADQYAGHFETRVKTMVKSAQKELDRLDLSSATEGMLKDLDEAKAKLKELDKSDFSVDFNAKKVLAQIEEVRVAVDRVTGGQHELNIDANLRKVVADVARIEKLFDEAARDREVKIEVQADTRKLSAFERAMKDSMKRAAASIDGNANAKLRELHGELERLQNMRVGIDIGGAQLRREVKQVQLELEALGAESVDIDVKFDTAKAFAELAILDEQVKRLDHKDIDIKVKVDDAEARRGLFGIARSGDDAANSFRSFNGIILAVAGAGPALVPILAAIGGGLLALGPAAAVAGVGLGAVLIGFSGLSGALQAYDALQKQQAINAQTSSKRNVAAANAIADATQGIADAERNAAQAAVDAAQRVADARQQAARSIESALQRQKDAQDAYGQSVQDVKDAEAALAQARKDAAGTGADIATKMAENKLAIDQQLLNEFNAKSAYDAVLADGSSTNAEKEQARINFEQAQLRMKELRKEQADLVKQKRKWDREGVNGTDAVKNAQDALNNAIAQQQKAYENLQQAARAVDQARSDGAKSVANAIRDQNRVLADNARNVDRAKEALDRAKHSQDALNSSINSQQNALRFAMSQLSPAGRKFARFLFKLKGDFQNWRNDIQTAMLPSIQEAIAGFLGSGSGRKLRQALVVLAGSFGEFAKQLSKSLQGEKWSKFFGMLAKYGPEISKAYGGAFIKLLEGMASLLVTLAPYALDFAKAVERLANGFAQWAASKSGQDTIMKFMAYAEKVGPSVAKAITALVVAFGDLLVALAPYGETILGLLTGLFNAISALATGPMAQFIPALFAMVTAAQLAYVVMNFLMAGTALLTSTVGLAVFAVLGLGLAIYYLYQQNQTLGTVLAIVAGSILVIIAAIKAWEILTGIITAVQGAFALATYLASGAIDAETASTYAQTTAAKIAIALTRTWMVVQAAFNAVMDANPIALLVLAIVALIVIFVVLFKKNKTFHDLVIKVWNAIKVAIGKAWDFIKLVFKAMGDTIAWLWNNVVKPVMGWIGRAFQAVFGYIKDYWNNILWPVLKLIGKVIWNLWKGVFKVALVAIKVLFKVVFVAIKLYWKLYLHPILSAIATVLSWLWKKVIKPVLGWVGDKFKTVFSGIKSVWEQYLKPVFDTIVNTALPKLQSAFGTAVDAIKTVWDTLKRIVGTPIKFVLDTIINHGLIDGFNKVAGWVGEKGFDYIPIPDALSSYATGGVLPGYTPGRDVHQFVSPTAGRLELSGGEAIMRPEWTAAMGTDYINQMNAMARRGGVGAVRRAMGFAKGGVYWPLPGSHFMAAGTGMPGWSTYPGHDGIDLNTDGEDYGKPFYAALPGVIAYVGWDHGYGDAIFENTAVGQLVYGHGSKVAVKAGQQVAAGQYIGNVGNTGHSSGPHLHFGFPGGTPAGALAVLNGATDIQGVDMTIAGASSHHGSIPGFIKDILLHPIDTIGGWIKSAWGSASEAVTSSPVFNTVKQIPSALIGGIEHKVWSVMPGWVKDSVGVAQTLTGAAGDVISGAGHVLGGIGDVIGLANGGILPYNGTMKYDAGGYLPPGLTSVVNLTGKPEPVFTHDQWGSMRTAGDGAGTIHYEPHFNGSRLTAEDVAADLNFTFRRIRRGGRYAKVGVAT